MADTDLTRLVVQLSADLRKYDNTMRKFTANTDAAAKKVEGRFGQMNRTLGRQADQFGRSLRQTIAAVATGYATREIGQLADQWTTLENSLRSVQQAIGRPTASMDALVDTALRTRTALQSTTVLYSRLERAGADLGRTQEEMRRVTELTNKAFVAGGAAASEQRSAILQLAQGIASGALQGDELRSIRENAPLVAQAIADAMGVGVGALRDLGAEGRITSEIIVDAILGAGGQIEAQFAATESTVGQAFQNLQTRAAQYVGQLDDATHASANMARFINSVAENLDALTEAAIVAAGVIGGALAARAMPAAIRATIAYGAAMTAAAGTTTIYVNAAGAAAARNTLLARSFNQVRLAALFFTTNPLGLAITGIAAAVGYLALESQNAASRADRLSRALSILGEETNAYGEATENAASAQRALAEARRLENFETVRRALNEQRRDLERNRHEWETLTRTVEQYDRTGQRTSQVIEGYRQRIGELSAEIASGEQSVAMLTAGVDDLSEAVVRSSETARESINIASLASRANEGLDDVLGMIVDTLGEASDAQNVLNEMQRTGAIDQATAALQRQVTALEEVEGAIQAISAARMAATATSLADDLAGEGGPFSGVFALSDSDAAEVAALEAAAERYRRVIELIRGFVDELNSGTNVGAAKDENREREQRLRREAEALNQTVIAEREFSRALADVATELRKGDTAAYTTQLNSLNDALDDAQDELAALNAQRAAGAVSDAEYREEAERLNGTLAQLGDQTERLIGLQDELDIAKRIVEETRARERLLSAQAQQLNFELELAQLRGNDEEIRRLEREVRMRERIAELVETQGLSRTDAAGQAEGEEGQREAARRYGEYRDVFARSFSDGIRAALSGDMRNFLSNAFGSIADEAFTRLGEQIFDAVFDVPADLAKASAEGAVQGQAAGVAIGVSMQAAGTTAASTIGQAMAAAGSAAAAQIAAAMRAGAASSGGGKGDILSALISAGSGGKIPGKEFGGRVQRGQPYIVGEKRPELFVPDMAGTIVPRVPGGAGSAGSAPRDVRIRLEVTEGDMFASRVEVISADVVGESMPVTVDLARQAASSDLASYRKGKL